MGSRRHGAGRDVLRIHHRDAVAGTGPLRYGSGRGNETRCQRRGDPRCVYEVRWDLSTSPDTNPQRRIEHLEGQLALMAERFESMQEATRELVSAENVENVLATIAARASLSVPASRGLLAVWIGPDDLRVHHHGFTSEDEARRTANEILADGPDDREGTRLIVDVAVGERRFGRLAALHPEGAGFFPAERRLLEAYAATAAATLNVATALESARRDDETARSLLHLASVLAEGGTVDDVAQRLADVLPALVGSNRATVLVWDSEQESVSHRGLKGYDAQTEQILRRTNLRRDQVPELVDMLESART